MRLILDTGSSDIFVNTYTSNFCKDISNQCTRNGMFDFGRSHSLVNLEQNFYIRYLDETEIWGSFVTDNFYVGYQKLELVQFGIAQDSNSPNGVLGLGYALNQAQVVRNEERPYDTILDHLVGKSLIKTKAYSLWLDDQTEGHILFGGIDNAKVEGGLTTFPIQQVSGDYREFIVILNSIKISHESHKMDLPSVKNQFPLNVLLDMGSSSTHLPPRITSYIRKMLSVVQEDDSDTPRVDCSLAQSKLKMEVEFGSSATGFVKLPISISMLVRPDGENCKVGFYPLLSGRAIIGHNILSSVYTVYDLTYNEISFGSTRRGATKSDIVEIAESNQKPEGSADGSNSDSVQSESQPDPEIIVGETSLESNSPGDSKIPDPSSNSVDTEDTTSIIKDNVSSEQGPAGVDDPVFTPTPKNGLAEVGNLEDVSSTSADTSMFLGSTLNENVNQPLENEGLVDASGFVKRIPVSFRR